MILKLILTMPEAEIPVNNQKYSNSYIHRCLGKDNTYHDSVSNYCVSSLQGGKLINGKLVFTENPYFIITTDDTKLINNIVAGASNTDIKMFDMTFKTIEISDFQVKPEYDKVITVSPILLYDKDKCITVNDEEWLDVLNKKCVAKLKHIGIEDSTFKIEFRHKEKAKVKTTMVGNIPNKCSMVGLTVYGMPNTRKKLYTLGLGKSTGSGFGCVKLYQ